MKLKTKSCTTCAGSGQVPDDSVGPALMAQREKLNITRAALAEALGYSDQYLRQLEIGERPMTEDKVERYEIALQGLTR